MFKTVKQLPYVNKHYPFLSVLNFYLFFNFDILPFLTFSFFLRFFHHFLFLLLYFLYLFLSFFCPSMFCLLSAHTYIFIHYFVFLSFNFFLIFLSVFKSLCICLFHPFSLFIFFFFKKMLRKESQKQINESLCSYV